MTLNEKISLIEKKFSIKVTDEMLFGEYVDGLVGVSKDNRLVYDRDVMKYEALKDYDEIDDDSIYDEIDETLDNKIYYLSYIPIEVRPCVMEEDVKEIMGDDYQIKDFVKWWNKNNEDYTEGFFFDDYYDALVGFNDESCFYDYEKLLNSIMQKEKCDKQTAINMIDDTLSDVDEDYKPVLFYTI